MNVLYAAGDGLAGFTNIDLAGQLATTTGVIAAALGGSALLAIGIWQLGLGIDVGLKKFTKITKKG